MFDRKTIRQHHEALDAIMKKYCEEHGLAFTPRMIPAILPLALE